MTGRLAIDFGTSNTVITLWDEKIQQGVPLFLPGFSRFYQQGNGETVPVIPSLIHYAADGRRWIGDQVFQRDLYRSPHTMRWMKRYISNRSPMKINIGGNEITPYQAGKDFLSTLILFVKDEFDIQDEEVGFSAPVEAYEHYENWLSGIASQAGINRFRLIDEPSAAALGYGAHIQPGNVYLIFDFGGGTLNISMVLIENENGATGGKRCRILGKSGKEIGGSTLDRWIYEEVLSMNHLSDADPAVRPISNALLVECEKLKEALSTNENAVLSLTNPQNSTEISAEFSRGKFDDLLDRRDLFSDINQALRAAINVGREHGYDDDSIVSVLAVGGSSQIPSVQRVLRQFFGKDRVFSHQPFDAVARGAAAFIAGVDFYDHIQHDYAIRYYNPQTCSYDYEVVVPRGTRYPTIQPVKILPIKAVRDGQTALGIDIFEIGESHINKSDSLELVFDPTGAACIRPISFETRENRARFWMNEYQRTFLNAIPPAVKGEVRFEVSFSVDINKRLMITAKDLQTSETIKNDFPVVKLS